MKIAVIGIKGIPARYGGFETCVDETSRRLVRNGFAIIVFCRKQFTDNKIENYEGVKLKYVGGINTKSFSTITSSFLSVIRSLFLKTDVIHLYTVGNSIFIPLLKLFGKKCVISVDALDWKRKKWGKFASRYIRLSEWIASKYADSVISDSLVICDYYMDNYGRKSDYVAFGANIVAKSGGLETLEKYKLTAKKYFLFVGLFRPEKNVDFLIKAFNNADTGDFKLVLIGDDPLGVEYVNYIYSLTTEKIRFLGRIYSQEYENISKNAFCYVTASEVEGTSPALLGAMGCRTAVLVSNIPENVETVGDCGFVFEVNNQRDLINKIEHLISNPKEVNTHAIEVQKRAIQFYSWDRISEGFSNIYNRIYYGIDKV